MNSHERKLWNFYQLSFLDFDGNVFRAILSIQNFFNLTEYRQDSLLITHAGMQIWIWYCLPVRTNGFFFKIRDPLIQLTWLDLGLPQIDLTSFWESGESCLGRKKAERATKSWRRSRERTSRLDCKGSFHYAKIFGNFGREKRQDSSVRVEISGQSGPKIIVSSLTLVSST